MYIDRSVGWGRFLPSQTAQTEAAVPWLRTALLLAALCLLVAVAAVLLRAEDERSVTSLLLVLAASSLLGGLMRSCWPLLGGRLAVEDGKLHPSVNFALRRLGRAMEEGLGQERLLELIGRSALDITKGAVCLVTLPSGRKLRVDRSSAHWLEPATVLPRGEAGAGRHGEASILVRLTALGEMVGTLEVWAAPGRQFDPDREPLLGLFCSEAAVAVRDAGVISAARSHADSLASKISDLERWQGQLDSYAVDLARTYGELSQARTALDQTYMATLEALANAVDARDPYTYGHCRRVAELASQVAAEMGVSEGDRRTLEQAALLHDIGKIGVPDATLRKVTPLTRDEWETIQTHPELGFKMLSTLQFLGEGLAAIRHHHEKFDGGGYPSRLTGEDIPLMARILSVADAYDAITSDRPYRPGRSMEQGIAEIQRRAHTHFDPAVVEAFLRVVPSLEKPSPAPLDAPPPKEATLVPR